MAEDPAPPRPPSPDGASPAARGRSEADGGEEPAVRIVEGRQARCALGALEDDDCRAILDATSDEPLTAPEISATCDIPSSTAYRKLELLTETGLVEEGTRVCRSGKHASEYVRRVEDVVVSVVDGRTELRLVRRTPENPPATASGAGD